MRMMTWSMIMTELQNVNCFPRIKYLAQFFDEAWVEIFTFNLNILREIIVKGQSKGRLPRKGTLKVFFWALPKLGAPPAQIDFDTFLKVNKSKNWSYLMR